MDVQTRTGMYLLLNLSFETKKNNFEMEHFQ